jgi:hypothetical protein
MARSRTVWKDGEVYAEYEGGKLTYLNPKYQAPKRSDTVQAPYFMKDIGEYRSPLDGQRITTRSAHRDHMKAHNVIEVGNERMPATPSAPPSVDRDLGQAIKQRLEEVKSMPQKAYDEHVTTQRAEHDAVGDLVTATPA